MNGSKIMTKFNATIFKKPEWMSDNEFNNINQSCSGIPVKDCGGNIIGSVDIGRITEDGQHIVAEIDIEKQHVNVLLANGINAALPVIDDAALIKR